MPHPLTFRHAPALHLVPEEFPPETSWKPKPIWMVFALRGFGETRRRIAREVPSLEAGRQIASELFREGWESAWVCETNRAARRVRKTGRR